MLLVLSLVHLEFKGRYKYAIEQQQKLVMLPMRCLIEAENDPDPTAGH